MSLLKLFFFVCLSWVAVAAVDYYLKQSRSLRFPYRDILDRMGVRLSFGYFRVYSVRLNDIFTHVEHRWPRAVNAWFTAGMYTGVAVMFASVILLALNLVSYFRSHEAEEHVLVPVVPGVNLPWNQVGYYFVILLFLAVVHEAGHAFAAAREQVRVNGFAVFLFLIYPGAYVDLQSDHLKVISPRRQLKIFCAGAWHNVVVALGALALLYVLPSLLWPFYSSGRGVVVTSVAEGSVMETKLVPGSRITAINSCLVSDLRDWLHCVTTLVEEPQSGYCMSVNVLDSHPSIHHMHTVISPEEGLRECCDASLASTHVCFYVIRAKSAVVTADTTQEQQKVEEEKEEEEEEEEGADEGQTPNYKCLVARSATLSSPCFSPRDCHGAMKQACVVPTVINTTRLLRIAHTQDVDALFLGDPRVLFMTVSVSDYQPRASLVWLQLPAVLETCLVYCVSLSGALALLNMLPVFALDGQWTFMAFVEMYCASFFESSPQAKGRLFNIVFSSCTVLLLLNIVGAFVSLL